MQASQAKSLTFEQRKQIALNVISNNYTVTQMSKQYTTSRKFINQQKKALPLFPWVPLCSNH